jgi:cytoskeletal protein RodZ
MSRRGRAIAGATIALVVMAVAIAAAIAWGVGRAPSFAAPGPTESPSAGSTSTTAPTPRSTTQNTPAPAQTDAPTPTPTPSTEQPSNVTVVLVYAQWSSSTGKISIDGFTGDVIESVGTCTATATGPSGSIKVSAGVLASATSTACLPLSIDGKALKPGKYSVTLAYSSPTSTGISKSTTVVVG